ncbi:hypothetical protein NDU88_009184 [Pleurodeles waltl]|uniref:Uncharacterized protein n=1 Tax=Pleurodeles waltl TaxID=8319 RepID=A0AAV7NYD8_PLEWA|nr:hypothetical protein NDU88_009184 [Pleurodeles waltl]
MNPRHAPLPHLPHLPRLSVSALPFQDGRGLRAAAALSVVLLLLLRLSVIWPLRLAVPSYRREESLATARPVLRCLSPSETMDS